MVWFYVLSTRTHIKRVMIGDAVRVTVIGLRVRVAFFRLRYGYGQSRIPNAPNRIEAGGIEGEKNGKKGKTQRT